MKKYQTLKHEMYDLDALPPDQQSIYEAVWNFGIVSNGLFFEHSGLTI